MFWQCLTNFPISYSLLRSGMTNTQALVSHYELNAFFLLLLLTN